MEAFLNIGTIFLNMSVLQPPMHPKILITSSLLLSSKSLNELDQRFISTLFVFSLPSGLFVNIHEIKSNRYNFGSKLIRFYYEVDYVGLELRSDQASTQIIALEIFHSRKEARWNPESQINIPHGDSKYNQLVHLNFSFILPLQARYHPPSSNQDVKYATVALKVPMVYVSNDIRTSSIFESDFKADLSDVVTKMAPITARNYTTLNMTDKDPSFEFNGRRFISLSRRSLALQENYVFTDLLNCMSNDNSIECHAIKPDQDMLHLYVPVGNANDLAFVSNVTFGAFIMSTIFLLLILLYKITKPNKVKLE